MAGDIEVSINTSNINRLWADLLVSELVRSGVRMFCLAPGSRSTPLTTAVAAHPDARHIMHFDERGSAFYALGFARAAGRPAAWITTSGTAVANGMPAVVEASVSGVPLILLTADRPPELRDTGANQTIDQVKFFGDYVRWHVDLPVPTTAITPEAVLTAADQAVYRSRRMPGGPVHINCMYREPLAPDDDGLDHSSYLEPLRSWTAGSKPYTNYPQSYHAPHDHEIDRLVASLDGVERGFVVAGRLASKAQGDAVRLLAEHLGWPILPDAGSQLRLGQHEFAGTVVPYFDLMLVSEPFRSRHVPEAVLQFGNRATSKRLGTFLSEARPSTYAVIHEGPSRLDPYHCVTTNVEADIISFCHRLVSRIEVRTDSRSANDDSSDSGWMASWRSASGAAARAIEEFLGSSDSLSEPATARIVSESVTEKSGLFLASSMPVRDIDSYGSDEGRGPFVATHRGASGIDGTVAAAVGFARGLDAPVTVLIGDLALLHDLNSLALAAQSEQPITIVVVNNHGGGIFSFLPIARHNDVFEPYFGTPHPYSFEHAATMFGISYERPTSLSGLREALTRSEGSTALIEVVTDRDDNVHMHRQMEELIAAELAKWAAR
jgi:2-succinyl-5-enolpyruvyl-6-hydroxy-3-cyclohexene-1-carboxylate synthase